MQERERAETRDLPEVPEATLREVVAALAPLDRTPCSAGERQAAEWLADRFARAGCEPVDVQEEHAWGTWPPTIVGLAFVSIAAAALVLRGRRVLGSALAAAGLAGFVDEVQNGPRLLRRAVRRRRSTVNVLATAGDAGGERTLVVLAHHDAAQAGRIFDQTWAKTIHARWPHLMEDRKRQVPQWWAGVAPALLTIAGAGARRDRPVKIGLGLSFLATAAVGDILMHPTVPGANDNLSGVAVLVALAEALRERPVPGVRVLLASCGSEESLQDGIRALVARHAEDLPPERTWFLNFDTVGSPDLVMLEGEGPVWMEDYTDPSFRALVADAARSHEIALDRGFRARASTDSIVPSRAGYPTATLVSLMPWRLPGNYHQMSDTVANLNFHTMRRAARLGLAVIEALGRGDPEPSAPRR